MRTARILAIVPVALALSACDSSSPSEPAVVVLSVAISPSSSELVGEGSSTTLTAQVQTEGAGEGPAVGWSSSAPGIVAVEGSGSTAVVTALAVGQATITASAGQESGSATVSVIPGSHTLSATIEGDGTLASEPEGLECGASLCEGIFPHGVEVVLTPLAGSESRFGSWGGECDGTGSCSVILSQPRMVAATFEPRVEDNGLSREINEIVPDSLLDIMTELGMPIHRGPNPPSLEGVYHVSPLMLLASNVPGDPASAQFLDYHLQFSDQDNEALTLTTDYVHGPVEGWGLGTFIVGSDDTFSVFAPITLVLQADTALTLEIYSGRIGSDGIDDFHIALFMLDNGGRSPPFIPNGTGRIGYDEDGFSPRIPALPAEVVAGETAVVGVDSGPVGRLPWAETLPVQLPRRP